MRIPFGATLVEGGTELKMECPDCGKMKLHINVRTKFGICFYCDKKLSPQDVIWDLGIATDTPQPKRHFKSPKLEPHRLHSDAVKYLKGRGVPSSRMDSIMYDVSQRRLYFPIWSPSPEYQPSYHTRGIDDGQGWQALDGTQRQHYWYSSNPYQKLMPRRACLVEGIFDAIALRHTSVYAILGTKLSNTLRSALQECEEVMLFLDPDEAGKAATQKIAKEIDSYGIDVNILEHIHEPGDCECSTVKTLVRKWLQDG